MKISILGCGWLGLPLATYLITQGHQIKGSTTTKSKIEVLQKNKIEPFEIQLFESKISGNITKFLENSEVLIIAIPPKLRGEIKENFVQKIADLTSIIENSNIKKVIFISSTAVYEDTYPIVEVTENTILHPKAENGIQILKSEQILQQSKTFKTTILRFGGLIGKDRNPIRILSGKKNIENPEAPVNLIHQDDCINIINELLKDKNNDKWGEIYNAVSNEHPKRNDYYCKKTTELGVEQPTFSTEISKGKLISNQKITTELEYSFKKSIFL